MTARLHAGFDIGGTQARLRLFDENWQSLQERRAGTREHRKPQALARLMSEMLGAAIEELDASASELQSLGIGLAGQLNREGTWVFNAPNLNWRDIAFLEILRDALHPNFAPSMRLRMVNDLSALLYGEAQIGAVQDIEDVLAVYVGTGVGGAIMVGGHIYDGVGGKAGEIGHTKVIPGGRQCGCGQRGCIEAYVGGFHLEEQVAELAQKHQLKSVFRADGLEKQAPERPSSDKSKASHQLGVPIDLAEADRLSRDHADLQALWSRCSNSLALVLANACTLLNPSVLLLGGGVLMNLENLRQDTLAAIKPLVLAASQDDLDIRFAQAGDDAGVRGAAQLAVESTPHV